MRDVEVYPVGNPDAHQQGRWGRLAVVDVEAVLLGDLETLRGGCRPEEEEEGRSDERQRGDEECPGIEHFEWISGFPIYRKSDVKASMNGTAMKDPSPAKRLMEEGRSFISK